MDSRVLDGNAIGGLLAEVFGAEMTTSVGSCGSCGAVSQVAEMAVYQPGLGTVVRCRSCDGLLMVFVSIRGVVCVDLGGLAALEPGGQRPGPGPGSGPGPGPGPARGNDGPPLPL